MLIKIDILLFNCKFKKKTPIIIFSIDLLIKGVENNENVFLLI